MQGWIQTRACLILTAAVAAGSAGCAAVKARLDVSEAVSSLAAAEAARAQTLAPYDYTHAVLAVAKARELESAGRLEHASVCAESAVRHATRARATALGQSPTSAAGGAAAPDSVNLPAARTQP